MLPTSSSSRRRPVATVPALGLLVLACGAEGPAGPTPSDEPYDGPLRVETASVRAVTNARVVDPATATVSGPLVVVVRDGTITAVGIESEVAVPAEAEVVDAGGAWLMPGLIDMHVHMRTADAEAYVRSGVTRVRNMWGFSTLPSIAARIESGELVGPAIHSLSSGLDRPPVYWPETQLVASPAEADSVVQRMFDLGYRELKLYQDLNPAVYDAIVTAAEARGMTFAGHKPSTVPLRHVLESGQRSIEHLGGYQGLQGSSLQQAVGWTLASGTWNCATLRIQNIGGENGTATVARRTITRALHEAGARLLIGTDSGIGRTRPGVSLVEEMDEFGRAGIALPAIVRMATVDAAEYLGLEDELGAVAPGKRADLVLLSGNPLESLDAMRRPLGVLMGERWIDMR